MNADNNLNVSSSNGIREEKLTPTRSFSEKRISKIPCLIQAKDLYKECYENCPELYAQFEVFITIAIAFYHE